MHTHADFSRRKVSILSDLEHFFFYGRRKTWLLLWSQGSFICITKKVVRWISDQNHIWWTWKIKLSRGTNDRRSWRGVRLKNNTFMFSFYWCNTALWYFNHGIQLTKEDFRMPGLYLVRLSAKDRIKCCSWRKININVGKIRRTVPAIAALSTVAHFCEIPGLEQVFFVKTTQPTFPCSKTITETTEQYVKFIQS